MAVLSTDNVMIERGGVLYKATAADIAALAAGGGGSGDVIGPEDSVDSAIVVFSGVTGKEIAASPLRATTDGTLVLPLNTSPAAANSGEIKVYSRKVAGRMLPAFIGYFGIDSLLQPFLGRNKIGYWNPPGNGTTVPGVIGFAAPTVTGFTAATRNVATTNIFTRMRRLGYGSAATAGSIGMWLNSYQYTVGSPSTLLGGFTYVVRFGISDAAAVAGARMFMGMRASSTPTNVEPSTLTNCIGVGHGAADTNLKLFYGGSAAQTPIDLGANYPTNTRSEDPYELALFSPNNSGDVYWEVTNLKTGIATAGQIVNSGGTVLPTNTTLIGVWGYRTNNTTALAVGLDVISAYIETDL